MPAKLYYLDDDDVAVLKELVAAHRARSGNTTGRAEPPDDFDRDRAHSYVVRAPGAGIPALRYDLNTGAGVTPIGSGSAWAGNTPGSASCQVYRTIYTGTTPNLLPAGFTTTVLNLSAVAIPGNTWVAVHRDRFGDWYAKDEGAATTTPPSATITARNKAYPSGTYTSFTSTGDIDFDNATGLQVAANGTGIVIVKGIMCAYDATNPQPGMLNNGVATQEIPGQKIFRNRTGPTVTARNDYSPGDVSGYVAFAIQDNANVMMTMEAHRNSASNLNDLIYRQRFLTRDGNNAGAILVTSTYTNTTTYTENFTFLPGITSTGSTVNGPLFGFSFTNSSGVYSSSYSLSNNTNSLQFAFSTVGGNPDTLQTQITGNTMAESSNLMGVNYVAGWARRLAVSSAPANTGSTGTTGAMVLSSGFLYICVATDDWRRVALSSF